MNKIIFSFLIILMLPTLLLGYNKNYKKVQNIEDFLIEQFKPFMAKGISNKELDHFESIVAKLSYCRYKVIKREVYFKCNNPNGHYSFHKNLHDIAKKHKLPDIDFIFINTDRIPNIFTEEEVNFIKQFPAFMMSKDTSYEIEANFLLMPDLYMMRNWPNTYKRIKRGMRNNNWDNRRTWKFKKNMIFWRGGSNSIYKHEFANFNILLRLKLIVLGALYPELIDAKFTRLPDDPKMHDFLNAIQGEPPIVTPYNHTFYKYLISVDGLTAAWKRVPWIMLTDSVLVKQESPLQQWFYSAMIPYFHYVPLKEDISDLLQQIEWMQNNDEAVRQIAINATKFIENNLTPKDIERHMVIILNEYAKMQNFQFVTANSDYTKVH